MIENGELLSKGRIFEPWFMSLLETNSQKSNQAKSACIMTALPAIAKPERQHYQHGGSLGEGHPSENELTTSLLFCRKILNCFYISRQVLKRAAL